VVLEQKNGKNGTEKVHFLGHFIDDIEHFK
jgi:hypothetical protein